MDETEGSPMTRSRSPVAAVAAASLAITAPALAQPDAAVSARAAAYDDALVAVMKQTLPMKPRVDRFRGIVSEYYDMPAIAALVAGPAWAGATAVDRAALIAALTRHSAISLAKNFGKYGGEKFLLDPAVQQRGDSAIVKVTIQSGGSRDILYYRMRAGRIIDVVSGGVSQLAVQRSDVAATAASGGVAAVVKRLDQVDAKAGG